MSASTPSTRSSSSPMTKSHSGCRRYRRYRRYRRSAYSVAPWLRRRWTPQSGPGDIILTPVGDITAALVNANETFFEVVSGVTELGLFELAEPSLRELRLDVVANQIDINYFDLLKPATIEEVEDVSELLTAPRSYLNRVLEEGEGPLEALDAEAGFVADTVVTRVGNAGDVVESYVQKQVDYFTEGFPTPSTGTAEIASVPASVRSRWSLPRPPSTTAQRPRRMPRGPQDRGEAPRTVATARSGAGRGAEAVVEGGDRRRRGCGSGRPGQGRRRSREGSTPPWPRVSATARRRPPREWSRLAQMPATPSTTPTTPARGVSQPARFRRHRSHAGGSTPATMKSSAP